ncbi:MAG: hypothetical protein ABI700_19895 [Chloroflexota bacterium]
MKASDLKLEDIHKAKTHVAYEWHQFEYCKQRLDTMKDPHNPTSLKQDITKEEHALVLSAYALHARSLISFFTDGGSQREKRTDNHDVLAIDYFASANMWVFPNPVLGEKWLDEQKNRMHRLAAHITYYRNDPDYSVVWEIDELFAYLANVWEEFKLKASPDRWVADARDEAKVSISPRLSILTTSLN